LEAKHIGTINIINVPAVKRNLVIKLKIDPDGYINSP